MEIRLKAYAKINLSLDVLERLENGYHSVLMIMASCDLHDNVYLKKSEKIELVNDSKEVPDDETNIMFKAAKAFFSKTSIDGGVAMRLEKNIPVAAGLAGGSADAAAVICGLNELYNTNLDMKKLCKIGLDVGADVPYCIKRGVMLASGIGEVLESVGEIGNVPIVIVKQKEGLSTAEIYRAIDEERNAEKPDTEMLCECIRKGNIIKLAKNMKNVMQQVSEKKLPKISETIARLKEYGAIGAVMSGSGPSVFGLFENDESAKKAAEKFKEDFVYCGKTI